MLRVVIDPGVLIAALISPKGAPRALLQAWIEGAFELIVSSKLLSELERVLKRDKFRGYIGLREVSQYLALLRRFATIAPDVELMQKLSPDPDDDYLLGLAASRSVACARPEYGRGPFLEKRIVDKLPERIFVLLIEAVLVAAGSL